MKVKKYHCDLYCANVVFLAGCNHKEASEYVRKRHGSPLDCTRRHSGGVWTIEDKDERLYVIWVRDKKDFSTMVHEVYHLVLNIFEDRGIGIDGDNQEPSAYYVEKWFTVLCDEMNKK